jgi:hypothetical protein
MFSFPKIKKSLKIRVKRNKIASLIHFAIFQAQAAIRRLILSPAMPLRKFRVNLKSEPLTFSGLTTYRGVRNGTKTQL